MTHINSKSDFRSSAIADDPLHKHWTARFRRLCWSCAEEEPPDAVPVVVMDT